MTPRHDEPSPVVTVCHDASFSGHPRRDGRLDGAIPVMTVRHDNRQFELPHRRSRRRRFHDKIPFFSQSIYDYPILHTVNPTTNNARAGDPATVVGYQFIRC